MLLLILLLGATADTPPCQHTAIWSAGNVTAEMFTSSHSCTHKKCAGNSTFVCYKLVEISACAAVDGNYALVPAEWIRELAGVPARCNYIVAQEKYDVLGGFRSSAAECCAILQYRGETIAAIAIMAAVVAGFCVFGVVHTCRHRD